MKKRDDSHQVALKKEQDEVSRLRKELEAAQSQTTEAEKTFAAEKAQLEEVAGRQKELLAQTEGRATSAQKELDILKAKCDTWLSELNRINSEMDSKFPSSFHITFFVSTGIEHVPA